MTRLEVVAEFEHAGLGGYGLGIVARHDGAAPQAGLVAAGRCRRMSAQRPWLVTVFFGLSWALPLGPATKRPRILRRICLIARGSRPQQRSTQVSLNAPLRLTAAGR